MIDDIVIELRSSITFAHIKDIEKCNPMVNISKFTSNKKILSEVITLGYN